MDKIGVSRGLEEVPMDKFPKIENYVLGEQLERSILGTGDISSNCNTVDISSTSSTVDAAIVTLVVQW